MIEKEWRVGRDNGEGWHEVGYCYVEVSRSGEVVKVHGVFWVKATVFGAAPALVVAKALAGISNDRVRRQIQTDLSSVNA